MFKSKFYIPALFAFGGIQAQTPFEQAKIISTYNSEKVESLNKRIQLNQAITQSKIQNYLSVNPTEKEYFSINGVNYRIVDIFNGRPVFQTTDNASAARAIKANQLYPGGALGLSLEGQGMNISMWDGGWVLM